MDELINQLRATESHSKRDLLDSAANAIEYLLTEIQDLVQHDDICEVCKNKGIASCECDCQACANRCACWDCEKN